MYIMGNLALMIIMIIIYLMSLFSFYYEARCLMSKLSLVVLGLKQSVFSLGCPSRAGSRFDFRVIFP